MTGTIIGIIIFIVLSVVITIAEMYQNSSDHTSSDTWFSVSKIILHNHDDKEDKNE